MKRVDDVIRQFNQRRMPRAVRNFLEGRGLGRPRANADVERILKDSIKSGRIKIHELIEFFHEQTLFTWKRVHILKHKADDVLFGLDAHSSQEELLKPNTDTRAAKRPPRSAFEGAPMPGFDVGALKIESLKGLEHRVLVTARTVTETLDLEQEYLTEEAQAKFRGFTFQSKRDVAFQCFDLIVKVGNRTLLLIDSPPKIDPGQVSSDSTAYRTAIDSSDPRPYLDIWPAVESIYADKNEGCGSDREHQLT